ncbi:hypothetical protein [Scytonema sp. HK-05]|uniref:hypothetical protein n=1 Tax=Scytonema sp. HK-05 TaxID=1137095 RepID=UPI0013011B54|nr:hypothetical protein [Scytonema sp. HK-05]
MYGENQRDWDRGCAGLGAGVEDLTGRGTGRGDRDGRGELEPGLTDLDRRIAAMGF